MSVEPAVPVVDLPRVNAAQFQLFDHSVFAFLVTDDDAMARWIDHLCSAAPATVAADIETRGLDENKFSITCVSVAFQLGADTVALLLDPLRRSHHRKLLARVFDHAARLVFHGASFDIAPLYAHRLMTREHIRKLGDTLVASRMVDTNAKAGRTLEDLATAFQLLDDSRITMDKVFDARGLKKADGWWSTDIDTPTYAMGAMSDTVATLRLWGEPGVHGHGIMAHAARYLTAPQAGFGGKGRLNSTDAEQLVEDIQRVNAIVLERSARGYAVDNEFPQRYREQTEATAIAAAHTLKEAGIRAGNGRDLVNVLAARGEIDAAIWPRTDTGQLKSDKEALKHITDEDSVLHSELATAHRIVANSEKVRGYVDKVVDNARPTGRLHPEIKILGASATGRMCLPTDQRLVTRRGIIGADDVREGDYTLDHMGQWVKVLAVHRYTDAPIKRHTLSDGTELSSTPEHRWLLHPPRGSLVLAPMGTAGAHHGVRLRPDTVAPTALAHHVNPASCPTCERAYRLGEDISIEGRAESLLRRAGFTPLLATVGAAAVPCVDPHPTAAWLYRPGEHESAPLLEVLSFDLTHCYAFLSGLTSHIGPDELDGAPVRVPGGAFLDAVKLAAYRLGVAITVTADQESWMVHMSAPAPATCVSTKSVADGDVWCVTTASGTFTAWGAQGPYLTGNSASKPEIQQFPSEARGVILADPGAQWISADWKSIEPVVLATASGDRGFLADMRAGKDPYEPVGLMAGIDRKMAKRKMLADMYSQGHKAAALQFGWTLERAKEVASAIRNSLPILYALIDALKKQSEYTGSVTTLSGRVVDQRFRFWENGQMMQDIAKRIAPNHFCQGSALDVMHYSILELDRRGLSDHVHLWMHDEIVADAEIQQELIEVMSTPPPFLEAVAQQHGMEAFLAVDVNPLGSRWQYV